MANLAETVNTQSQLAGVKKVVKVCLTKTDLRLSAAAEKSCQSKRFYLVKLPIRKLPLFAVEASSGSNMIVVDVNSKRKKATASGFTPKVVLLKGLQTLQAEKAADKMFCSAWVGEKALKKLRISAEDAIGANEMQTKLQRLISAKYKNMKASKATSDSASYSPSPWISEVYPFDLNFIFNYDGETYRQNFTLDNKTHEPSLIGEPVEIFVKYAPQAINAGSLADVLYADTYLDRTMSQEMLFDKINNSSPALGAIAYNPPIVPDGTC
jgi:hypothetical protein